MTQEDAQRLLRLSQKVIELLEKGEDLAVILAKMQERDILALNINQNPDHSHINPPLLSQLKLLHDQEKILLLPYRAELKHIQEKLARLKHLATYQNIC